MSEVQNEQVEDQTEEQNDETAISPEAYKRVSQDMHKYKSKMKEFQGVIEALKIEKEQNEQQKLVEQNKWQDLYKKSEEKLKALTSQRDSERNKFIDSHKKNAVIQALGGFKRSDYSRFVDVSQVDLAEDGTVNEDSVQAEVSRIRKEFPELLKSAPKPTLPDKAPGKLENKSLSEMTPDEKNAYRRNLLTKPN